jgi:hypothetical protein
MSINIGGVDYGTVGSVNVGGSNGSGGVHNPGRSTDGGYSGESSTETGNIRGSDNLQCPQCPSSVPQTTEATFSIQPRNQVGKVYVEHLKTLNIFIIYYLSLEVDVFIHYKSTLLRHCATL